MRRAFEEAVGKFENARMVMDAEWDSSTAQERTARRHQLAEARREVLRLYDEAASRAVTPEQIEKGAREIFNYSMRPMMAEQFKWEDVSDYRKHECEKRARAIYDAIVGVK